MDGLIKVENESDIFTHFKNTPIELLLQYHNFNMPYETHNHARILISMCMDNRKKLNIPENFAFILRSGGGNLRHNEFKVSFAIAVGNVEAIALIAHNYCGMVNLHSKKEQFINGLVEKGGWDRKLAEDHFLHFAPFFEIGNEMDFTLSEAKRLRLRYPKIQVAPLYYNIDDNLLYQMLE